MLRYAVLLLCALVCGACEYNYYYEAGDAGAVEDAVASEGNESMCPAPSIFKTGSKLQGQENLIMDGPVPTLIDVETVGNIPHLVTLSVGNAGNLEQTIGLIPDAEMVMLLEMGIGGAFYTAEVDMVRGQQISLVASTLRVNMRFNRIPGAAAIVGTPPTWGVGASIAQGVIAHGQAPQRTRATANALAANVGVAWPVPPFSKSFVVSALPNTANLDIRVVRQGGATIESFPTVAYPTARMPIASDAWAVTIFNSGLNPVTEHRVIFDLSL
jgi:hypothetical protein